jgi:hypothetical protein
VQLLSIGAAFPGVARNAGIAAAAHEWAALLDAGTVVGPGWLAALWRAHEEQPAAEVVFGHYEPVLQGWLTECATLAYVAPCVRVDGGWWRGDSFASALLHRELWTRCGGFPPYRAAEDLIFLEAIQQQGGRIAAAPEAKVAWEIPVDAAGTFRRFANYSRHNLVAGRGRYWHRGVARLYAAAAAMGLAGAAVSPIVWALLPAAAAVRAGRAVHRRRGGSGVPQPWRPDRLVGVAMLLMLTDAATAWGALAWAWHDRWGLGRAVPEEAPTARGMPERLKP